MKINFSQIKAVKYLLLIVVLYKVVSLVFTGGGDLFRLSMALEDPEEAYLMGSTKGSITIFNYVDMIFAPMVTIAVSGGIFFWKKLSLIFKALLVGFILFVILSSIGASVRSSIIAILLCVFSGLILSHVSGNFKFTLRLRLYTIICFFLFILLFFMYTDNLVKNRSVSTLTNPLTLQGPNENSLFFRILSDEYVDTITGISFYLGHSYYRLNQAMQLPFQGLGFGFSNSFFLMENVERITGWDGLKTISYGYRLDMAAKTNPGVFWSTTYTWFASDFTFPGVVIIVFLLGYWLCLSMKDTMLKPNIFAIATFANLFAMIYSLPTVNPLQDGSGISNFTVIFLLWIFLRKKETQC